MAHREYAILTFKKKTFSKRYYTVYSYDDDDVFRSYNAWSGESIQIEVSQAHHYIVSIDCEGTSTNPFSLPPGGVYLVEEDGGGLLGFKPKITRIG